MTIMTTCRICGAAGEHAAYTVREMMLGTGDPFLYFQCGRCRCLQIVEIPADMESYYPPGYYSFSSTSRDKTDNPAVSWFRQLRNHFSVSDTGIGSRMIRALFPNRKLLSLLQLGLDHDSRILDVGCGSGWRLYALREAGFINTLGIDPFIGGDIAYANGLRVLKRTVQEVEGRWDVVMFHHSLEHIPDQAATLRATAALLDPGGTCLVRIPTVSSYAWEHYREHWYQIDAPRHFYLHSEESMRILAEQSGLAMRRVVYDSTVDQFRTSELYRMGPGSLKESGFTREQVRAWKRRAMELNREGRGDQAAFYLQKDDVDGIKAGKTPV
jgi:SAM-dependent methyltransferase